MLKTHTSNFDEKGLRKIDDDLTLEIKNGMSITEMKAYELKDNDDLLLPFSYAVEKVGVNRHDKNRFGNISVRFTGELREEQIKVKNEAIEILNKKGSVMISSFTGFGKSIVGCYLACKGRLKIIILIPNKTVLIGQWKEAFGNFTENCHVQILESKDKIDMDADVVIMNAMNVSKRSYDEFRSFGTVIVDEAHLIVSDVMLKSFEYFSPRYLIGLSATPYRSDGLNGLLPLYFGTDIIFRKLNREHLVYYLKTSFIPEVSLMSNGKINWNVILNSQAESEERNDMLIRLIKLFKDKKFLVLVKRINQGKYLFEKLKEKGESVDTLLGTKKVFDKTARILIGTIQKCGVGFDHPDRDALIVAGDLEEYFIQYLGRVFRKENTTPLIFDIVDKHGILYKHYLTRRSCYIDHGGVVKNFEKDFPNFKII